MAAPSRPSLKEDVHALQAALRQLQTEMQQDRKAFLPAARRLLGWATAGALCLSLVHRALRARSAQGETSPCSRPRRADLPWLGVLNGWRSLIALSSAARGFLAASHQRPNRIPRQHR